MNKGYSITAERKNSDDNNWTQFLGEKQKLNHSYGAL